MVIRPGLRFGLSWWLAAEFTRRHPELIVREVDADIAIFNSLDLIGPDSSLVLRLGRLRRHGVALPPAEPSDYWPYHRLLEGKLTDRIEFIESAAGLTTPKAIPASTPRTLTYRAIAQISTITMLDDGREIVAHKPYDGTKLFYECPDPGHFAAFPLVEVNDPEARQRQDRYWILSRNGSGYLAMLDTAGYVFVGESMFHLPTVYAQRNGNLLRTVLDVFGEIF
ncbi:hypothetical protein AB0M20_32415 [Actinoplanes sp. NPDC051633]|uniref:TY-Chap2 family putative peptide chaperone n=1 Tax=Actinoplanes sp. NPDC051633 TaxID=3155670 RepID=UPI00344AAB78